MANTINVAYFARVRAPLRISADVTICPTSNANAISSAGNSQATQESGNCSGSCPANSVPSDQVE